MNRAAEEGTRRGKLPRGLGGLLKQGIPILEMNFNETQQSMPKIVKLGKRFQKNSEMYFKLT